MKKSCFLISYEDYIQTEKTIGLIKRAKNDGFGAIEPYDSADFFENPDYLDYAKEVREELDREGMKCSCFSIGINMLKDPSAAVERLKKCVDIAHILGAPFLHHTMELALSFKGLPVYQQVEKIFADVSRTVAEYAGEKGMDCIYEDQGFLINTVERLGSLISRINMPNTGVCLDVGNALFYDVAPEDYAGAFAPLIKHVHVKDYIRKTTYPGKGWYRSIMGNYLYEAPIGHGVVDFEKIMTILLDYDYDGYYSLEGGGIPGNVEDGIRRSMETLEYYYECAKEKSIKKK